MSQKVVIAVKGQEDKFNSFNVKVHTSIQEAISLGKIEEIAEKTWLVDKNEILLISKIVSATEYQGLEVTVIEVDSESVFKINKPTLKQQSVEML